MPRPEYVMLSDLRPFPEYPLGITSGELLAAACVGGVIWMLVSWWGTNAAYRRDRDGHCDGVFVLMSAFLSGPFIVAATILVAAWVLK